jgi:hypothetical protein
MEGTGSWPRVRAIINILVREINNPYEKGHNDTQRNDCSATIYVMNGR